MGSLNARTAKREHPVHLELDHATLYCVQHSVYTTRPPMHEIRKTRNVKYQATHEKLNPTPNPKLVDRVAGVDVQIAHLAPRDRVDEPVMTAQRRPAEPG
eukprot:scaffold98377_cov56-Phaeocystis_antarctica.AAC.1